MITECSGGTMTRKGGVKMWLDTNWRWRYKPRLAGHKRAAPGRFGVTEANKPTVYLVECRQMKGKKPWTWASIGLIQGLFLVFNVAQFYNKMRQFMVVVLKQLFVA